MHKFSTLIDLVRTRATNEPNRVAYTFLVDGKTQGASLSYGELDTKARAIGSWLQKYRIKGERVLLLYPQSLEFITAFFGCLYAGAIAIPAPAPEGSRLKRTLPRLQAIARDAQSSLVLTTSEIISLVNESRKQIPEFQAMTWLASETADTELAKEWQTPELDPQMLAYLQYTSGSTSTPKGVMISHENILWHCSYLQRACRYQADSITVTWMPYFHDYGLVEGLLEPLYNGTPCYLMSPFSFIRRPFHWLKAISDYKATHSQGPNFAYDQCVRRITPEQREQLDLSSWKAAGNAAEPINPKVLKDFQTTFEPYGFKPQAFSPAYGLAEATLLVSFSKQTEIPIIKDLQPEALEQGRIVEASDSEKITRKIPSCGSLVCETKVAIVNPKALTKCAPDEIGEIWVSDPGVAQGYWKRPEETERVFEAYISDTKEGPFLRTGDLGFMQNGQLFVSSRIKDVIIIRGTNHYPQDIEWTIQECHKALRPENGAAFSLQVAGEERLVITQEIERDYLNRINTDQLIETIRSIVADQHEIQVYGVLLLKPGSIPKTSSGKIQRSLCRQKFIDNNFNEFARWISSLIPGETSMNNHERSSLGAGLENSLYPVLKSKVSMSNNGQAQQSSKVKTDELILWLRNYANERINSRLIDERKCIPPHIILDFGNQGLFGLQVPPEQGGLGLNNDDTMRIMEQLGAIDLSLALIVFNHNILGIRPIQKYGNEELRKHLIPLLARGRELAAFAVSEPTAGSNPRGIATKAIPEGKGVWRLEGIKYWSGLAAWSGVMNVFAQTLNDKGEPEGISGFAVRQGTPGLRQGPECLTLGMRGMIQNTIYLEKARVTDQQLLGKIGNGMEAAQDAMMYGRLIIGAFSLGGMKRCAQLMHRYASRRSIATGRLLDNPVTLTRLGEINAKICALETLIKKITYLLDRGDVVPTELYVVCKIAGAEFFSQSADALIQLLGGRGYLESNIAPQILRDARVCRIFEGPTETLNMFLGSQIINRSEQLHQFLCDQLKTAKVSQDLKTVTEKIQKRCLGGESPFTDRTTSIRWASALVGEVGTYGILLAMLEDGARDSVSEQLDRAVNWAKLRFEQMCEVVLSRTALEASLSNSQATADLISNYTQTIGDIEQTLAGEGLELDPILRKDPTSTDVDKKPDTNYSEAGLSTEVASVQLITQQSTEDVNVSFKETVESTQAVKSIESIQQWLLDLLVQEWEIPKESIHLDKSFADYGIDSVMAVSLAQEIEDRFKYPVEATIAWNFPTIRSLARHIVNELEELASNVSGEMLDQTTQSLSQDDENEVPKDLEALSEAEMAQLLAAEVSKVQKRK